MEYALFLTSSGEIRKVREYATLAEADQAAAENNDALALLYVPPKSRAYYKAFQRVPAVGRPYNWVEPLRADNVVPLRRATVA